MNTTRRQLLAGAGVGLAAGLSGCTGQLTGDGAAFAAGPATLPESVQSDTNYTHHRTFEDTIVREFERFGISRQVEVTNVIAEYDQAIDLGIFGGRFQAAVFSTLATPQVNVLGRSFNPVGDMSPIEIAEMIQERYDNIDGVTEDAHIDAEVAGETTDVTRFTAEARLMEAGLSVEVYLYVSAAVDVGDDFIVTFAAHPRAFGQRADAVRRLMAAVEHDI